MIENKLQSQGHAFADSVLARDSQEPMRTVTEMQAILDEHNALSGTPQANRVTSEKPASAELTQSRLAGRRRWQAVGRVAAAGNN